MRSIQFEDINLGKQFHDSYFQIKERSDKLINYFLLSYFLIGLFLATYYDTWEIAWGVGGLSLIAYYSTKWMLPGTDLYQYVLSVVTGIFMAQYIYQMHGMFEMHFFAFIGSTILVTYQNWKLQIPLTLVVVIHHATFGYLQYIGMDAIYFTQLDYMTLQTFIFHGILAAIIFTLCGLWAYNFRKYSRDHIVQSFEIGKLQEANLQKETLLAMSESLQATNTQLKEAQSLARVGNWSFNIETSELFWSEGLKEIYGVARDFVPDLDYGLSRIHPDDRQYVTSELVQLREHGISTECTFSHIDVDGEIKILSAKSHAELNVAGKPVRIYGIIQDITEQRRAEATEAENKDINDSLIYAQRLQKALFCDTHTLEKLFPNSFILNKPQHIVGGDFYWLHQVDERLVMACVDCTGHGVPGAFMSIIGVDLLNKIVKDQRVMNPSTVLFQLDNEINHSIGLQKEGGVMDGMDLAYCEIYPAEKKILFAGAMNPIILVTSGEVRIFSGSRYSVGGYQTNGHKVFDTHEISYNAGDMLYMFSDGYCDQLGGAAAKRFKRSGLVDMISKTHMLDGADQKATLHATFDKWKGTNDQTDDVMVIGIRLP